MIAPPLDTPVVSADAPPVGMSIDDFLRIPIERFELIDGEIVEKMPHLPDHDESADTLMWAIKRWLDTHPLGLISKERTFVLPGTERKNWVKGSRLPDLMFIRQHRLDAYIADHPHWRKEPFALIPDLVVEIVSENDENKDILEKVNRYLDDGVPLVWVVDSRYRHVTIYRAEGDPITVLTDKDMLDGGDLIPGFQFAVAALFA
ncbi:MAG: Uma2 family endonuclease [Chloroflexota bacterium]|nr:Uma2 family endonuclease [Chloroflexota bacterium]